MRLHKAGLGSRVSRGRTRRWCTFIYSRRAVPPCWTNLRLRAHLDLFLLFTLAWRVDGFAHLRSCSSVHQRDPSISKPVATDLYVQGVDVQCELQCSKCSRIVSPNIRASAIVYSRNSISAVVATTEARTFHFVVSRADNERQARPEA